MSMPPRLRRRPGEVINMAEQAHVVWVRRDEAVDSKHRLVCCRLVAQRETEAFLQQEKAECSTVV